MRLRAASKGSGDYVNLPNPRKVRFYQLKTLLKLDWDQRLVADSSTSALVINQ